MEIGSFGFVGGIIDQVIEGIQKDKGALEILGGFVKGGPQQGDTLTETGHGAEPVGGGSSGEGGVEWFARFTGAFQMAREALERGYASSPDWKDRLEQTAEALGEYFDLLDTAAGRGGADGFVSRADLEAALRNPNLPPELRRACRFLLENPAAFNELDVGAGQGPCDGIIARSDLEAILARLAARREAAAEAGEAGEAGEADGAEEVDAGDIEEPEIDECEEELEVGDDGLEETEETEGPGTPTPGAAQSEEPRESRFEGMNPEEIVEALMFEMLGELDDAFVDSVKELEKAEDRLIGQKGDSKEARAIERDISRIQLRLQKLMEQRKMMFDLISTMSSLHHQMARSALTNMGRA